MEIKFTFRLVPPRSWVRASVFAGALVAVLGTGIALVHADITLNTFTAGKPIVSMDVNANFTALATAVQALQTQVDIPTSYVGFSAYTASFQVPGGDMVTTIQNYSPDSTLANANPGGGFDFMSGVYTAPIAGYYRLSTIGTVAATDTVEIGFYIGGALGGGYVPPGSPQPLPSMSLIVYLSEGATIELKVAVSSASGITLGSGYGFYFQGQFLGT